MVLEKIFLIGQSQTAYGRHISHTIGMEYGNVVQDIPYLIPTK